MKTSTPNGRAKPPAAAAAAAVSESTGGRGSSTSPESLQPAPMLAANAPPPFLAKTYEMVDDPSTNMIVSWSPTNNSFVVWDQPEFTRNLLPKYFKHNNFSSFVRQLNTYGFKKVDHDRHEFANKDFLRGHKHLLKTITRKKGAHGHVQQPQPQQPRGEGTPVGPCIEIGKFGLEEEVESLKRDKNVLMQELVRLRQQQQSTDGQLQTMVQHLQGMEQRQQQMMSFLAKAVNSPGFLAQFVQQQNDSSRRITERSKKRRLKQDGVSDQTFAGTDGQIVKYQPLINEAAKAMLRKLMQLDPSPRLDNFLIDNGDASKPMDCERTNHAVSLQDIPPTYVHSSLPLTSPITVQNSPADPSDVQPGLNITPADLSPPDITIPQLSQLPGIISPECDNDILETDSLNMNGKLSLDSVDLASDAQIDWDSTLFEGENLEDLPGSIDPFWVQFLKSPSHAFETEEMESAADEGGNMKPQVNGWGKSQHLDQLTTQMGNLGSEAGSV